MFDSQRVLHLERKHLSFHGPHRRPERTRQALDAARPRARREYDYVRTMWAAVRKLGSGHAPIGDEDTLHWLVLTNSDSHGRASDLQGRNELAVVDLMVLRAPDRAGKRAKMRLPTPRLAG